ncbi:MAG: imidazolonepropionase [Treponema sp.]|nr:MAG: imidazolonepropionase [Treponema sp.]
MNLFLSDCIFTAGETHKEPISGFVLENAGRVVLVEKGDPPKHFQNFADNIIDAKGKMIIPGFIDSHTHLVHGGSRENELSMKLAGKSYMEIHKVGGILSTVRSTREADEEELESKARKSLNTMLKHGTTTVESKSGYGLDLETELKCLRVSEKLNKSQPIDIVHTYMGAHSTPPEFAGNTDGYIDYMIKTVMPKIKEQGIAEFVDAFCEDKIFSVEQTEKVLQAAKDLGYRVKLHADEIVPFQGAELAAKMQAISAEHLMAISDEGIKAIAKSGTVAVLLPATSFFLMSKIYAPALKMIEEGVRIAIATDFNPGSSPTENIQMAMWIACYKMKLPPMEIIKAVTINAAHAIGREDTIGSLEKGKQADILVVDSPSLDHFIYHFGVNSVEQVWKRGIQVYKAQQLNSEYRT